MPPAKVPGTEDTVAETATDDTLAAPVSAATQPRARNDSGVRTPVTVGDSLRGANIESFESVDRLRYEVLGEMARGGLGRVMRARDPRTGRIVALKEIIVPNHETVARFAREALVTANLQHPSIVPVYEVGRWPNGDPFYTMKLVQGRTLSDLIGKAKTPAERMALLPHAIAVADALAYAHSEHVIHRDLKPGNVLVGSYGETVVIDWGLARNTATGQEVGALSNPSIDLGTDTVLGTVIGTPSYMPPEQALGAPIDEGADVYAIGALIYHMLAGARPYADAKTVEEVVERVKTGPPAPLATLAPETPPELIAIVEKAMARTLAARYRSAEGLAEDLRRFQTGKLVGAHRYTTWQLVQRWVRKYRAMLGIGVLALAALAVVGAISVRRIASERDEAEQQRALAQRAEGLAVERYASSLEELARQALVAGAPERTAAILAGVAAKHRTPTLGILAGQASAAFSGLVGIAPAQPKTTLAAAITHDGKRLVVASGEGKLVAWDVERGVQLWTGEGALVEFAPDDRALLVAKGGEVSLRDLDDKQLASWQLGEDVSAIAWSPTGDRFAVGGNGGAVAIGTPGGALVPGERHGKAVHSIAFGAAGLATAADDGTVIVHAQPPKHLVDAQGAVWAVAWLDPKHLVAGGVDHLARIWNVETGTVERKLDHGIDIYGLVAGAGWVATYGYGEHLKVWPLAGGPPRELVGHHLGVNNGVTFGDALVTSDETGQVIAWDPTTGQRLRSLPYEGLLDGLVSRGGNLVAFGELRTRVWRFDPYAIVRRAPGHTARIRDLAFGANTLWTASNDGTVRGFALDGTPRVVLGTGDFAEPTITGPDDPNMKRPPNPHGARAVVMLPDGKRVATTYEDGRILVWDAASGVQLASWQGHTGRVRGIAFAADGAHAYSVGDTTVRMWDVATGKERARAELGAGGWAVAVHGDVVVTQNDDGALALWSAATLGPGAKVDADKARFRDMQFAGDRFLIGGREMIGFVDGHTGKVVQSAQHPIPFSSDIGENLVVVGDSHGEVALYDRKTLSRIRSWRTGDDLTTAVRLRPDGKILATASARNIRIWDPATGSLLVELRDLPAMMTRIEWSPDGTHLAIAGGASTVWIWDLAPAAPAISCATPWELIDGALVAAGTSMWCAPTSR